MPDKRSDSERPGPLLAELFARDGFAWNELEAALTPILANGEHRHAGSLRELLDRFGYSRRSERAVGFEGLAERMREAEKRVEAAHGYR